MLEFLRKHTMIVMAAVAAVFIGLVFLNDGKSGASPWNTGRPLFQIDGTTYTDKDYNEKYARYFIMGSALRQSILGDLATLPLYINVKRIDDWEMGINLMINSVFLQKEADRYGIYPGKEEIDEFIQTLPEFLNKDFSFNLENYDRVTSYGGKAFKQQNEKALREFVGDVIRLRALQALVMSGVEINPAFANALSEAAMQSMDIHTAFLDESLFKSPEGPTEDQIKEFWEKRAKNYLSKELRTVTLYVFKPKAEIKADDKKGIPSATNDLLSEVELIWEKIAETNAKEIENTIAEGIKGQEDLFTMTKQVYNDITADGNVPDTLKAELNPAAGPLKPTLIEVAFEITPPAVPVALADETGQTVQAKPLPPVITADNISTALVLKDGSVALLTVDKVVPVAPLPYEEAKEAATADLISQNTQNALEKAANELREKLVKDAQAPEQFKSIAEGAKAKVEFWTGETQQDASSPIPMADKVLLALRKVNRGGISPVLIDPGKGAVIARLDRRTIPNSPLMARLLEEESVRASANMQRLLGNDWIMGWPKRHNFQLLYVPQTRQDEE